MKRILIICLGLLITTYGLAQTTIEDCYKGGKEAFYVMLMYKTKYPTAAKEKGIEGISRFSFTVDCNNRPIDFRFTNPVGYGIEEAVKTAILASEGSWCDCDKINNSRFTMNFLFTLSDYTSDLAELKIKGFGSPPFKTSALEAKIEKQLAKGKFDKAKENLAILLFKYPENEKYMAWEKALNEAPN